MSKEYDSYLETHKNNVQRGYKWLRTNPPKLFDKYPLDDDKDLRLTSVYVTKNEETK